jgi:hypothetical protein
MASGRKTIIYAHFIIAISASLTVAAVLCPLLLHWQRSFWILIRKLQILHIHAPDVLCAIHAAPL